MERAVERGHLGTWHAIEGGPCGSFLSIMSSTTTYDDGRMVVRWIIKASIPKLSAKSKRGSHLYQRKMKSYPRVEDLEGARNFFMESGPNAMMRCLLDAVDSYLEIGGCPVALIKHVGETVTEQVMDG